MKSALCLVPALSLDQLSDSELLAATRSLVGRSNQLLAALLAHLGEVEARGIHRIRACSSLYTYCIHELRLSEDEAYRRVAASRLVRRFPALLGAIASGELHLTGLLLLGPHLNENNLSEVLRRAKHRTKKEVAALVRMLDPLPDVPARIEPLGPAPAQLTPGTPTWSAFMQSLCPVRELTPGDRPRDWVGNDGDPVVSSVSNHEDSVSNHEDPAVNCVSGEQDPAANGTAGSEQMGGTPSATAGTALGTAGAPLATVGTVPAEPATLEAPAPARVEPQRYRVEFTASEEYVKLVEEAKALLAHTSPRVGLDELHLYALRALVAELKKQKYAVSSAPRNSPHPTPPDAAASRSVASSFAASRSVASSFAASRSVASSFAASDSVASDAVASSSAASSCAEPGRVPSSPVASRRTPTTPSSDPSQATRAELEMAQELQPPRQRGRHVPAAVRRVVFARDAGRCTYVSASGERCRETHGLEIHHLRAYALEGPHSEENLTLRCRAHNALAAEEELGRDVVDQRRDSLGHEPFARQRLLE